MKSHLELSDRVAIVTGASSGIGAESARALAVAGARVVLVGRSDARLNAVQAEIEAASGTSAVVLEDVSADDAPDRIVAATLEAFGKVNILVHAAGIFLPASFPETTDDILDRQWLTNVRAPYRLTRSAEPHLGAGASVIFFSSICGYVGFPNATAYCATKGAVEMLVKSLSTEFAPRGIRVNAIAPGNVRTSMNAHLFEDTEYERQMLEATPAGRVGLVDDIAPAVVFLASPGADYIHGASLLIDGGWTAR